VTSRSNHPPAPQETPIPTRDLDALTRAVGRIEGRVTSIQEEQLPPVAAAASEARDGVLKLNEQQKTNKARLRRLEDADAPDHICQREGEITAMERELAGLSKWRWWLMGLVVTTAVIGGSWAVGSARDLTGLQTDHASTKRDVARHEREIDVIEKAQHANREAILSEIRGVPGKVRQAMPETDIEDTLDDRSLTARERALVKEILNRAERRETKRDSVTVTQ